MDGNGLAATVPARHQLHHRAEYSHIFALPTWRSTGQLHHPAHPASLHQPHCRNCTHPVHRHHTMHRQVPTTNVLGCCQHALPTAPTASAHAPVTTRWMRAARAVTCTRAPPSTSRSAPRQPTRCCTTLPTLASSTASPTRLAATCPATMQHHITPDAQLSQPFLGRSCPACRLPGPAQEDPVPFLGTSTPLQTRCTLPHSTATHAVPSASIHVISM